MNANRGIGPGRHTPCPHRQLNLVMWIDQDGARSTSALPCPHLATLEAYAGFISAAVVDPMADS